MRLAAIILLQIFVFLPSTLIDRTAGAPPPCTDPNCVAPGALTLTSTMESISVRAKFTNDDNDNATGTMRYRTTSGPGAWKTAYTPIVDRRATIFEVSNATYQDEGRGSIVALVENTSYDVEFTWVDADGVNSGNPVTGTVSTLSWTPTAGGSTFTVDGDGGADFTTITAAISGSSAGDTILVRDAAAYTAFTISVSGTASAYRVLQNDAGATPTIAAGAANNITLNGNYWKIKGFAFAASPDSFIKIGSGQNHIYIESNTSTDCCTDDAIFAAAGVNLQGSNNNIYIRSNSFTRTDTGTGSNGGVYFRSTGADTIVICDNTFSGNFRDGISNEGNSFGNGLNLNSDVCRNTISGYNDDSLEMDGSSVNVRAWLNKFTNNHASLGFSAISESGTMVGPSYIFRNVLICIANAAVVKGGGDGGGNIGAVGWSFLFHNVMDSSGVSGTSSGAITEAGGPVFSENHTYRNNIYNSKGNVYDNQGRTNNYNYNLAFIPGGVNIYVNDWQGVTDYTTWADFKSANPTVEVNGISDDPAFINPPNKEIGSGSPARNIGVVLANFNDADSFWPFKGSAPDMGWFEFQE